MEWAWSDQLGQADWIGARQPVGAPVCTVPTGFAACARLLHPLECDSPVEQARWAHVAEWAGATVSPTTRFWQLALPERLPPGPVPCDGDPPSDTLGPHDGPVLAQFLRAYTTTPDQCWFGLWNGYGWVEPGVTARPDDPARFPAKSVEYPAQPGWAPHPAGGQRPGPLVRLPNRDYLLYTGPVEAGMAFLPEQRELADLWWPQDRAWFVYGDVDLNSTYVAGSAELINALLESSDLEALDADPDDPVVTERDELPDWLALQIEQTVSRLLTEHRAELPTSRFTVSFELTPRPPRRRRGWRLQHRCDGPADQGSGGFTILSDADLAAHLRSRIIITIVDILEG